MTVPRSLLDELGEQAKVKRIADGFVVRCRICYLPNGRRVERILPTIPELKAWWHEHETSTLHFQSQQFSTQPIHLQRQQTEQSERAAILAAAAEHGHEITIDVKNRPYSWKCSCGQSAEGYGRPEVRESAASHATRWVQP